MADISSTFGPDGAPSTVTQVGGYQGSDYGDITDFYKELFRRRAALAQPQPSAVGGSSQPRGPAPQRVGYNPERGRGFDPVDFERQRAQLAQLRAVSGQAPMRMVQGAGITPGYMPDTNAMNGAQRAAFLPNNSQMTGGPGQDTDPNAFRRFQQESAYRRQIQDLGL